MKSVSVAGFLFAMAIVGTAFQPSSLTPIDYRKLGDSLSLQAQQVLVRNLLGAIQKGGSDYAVDFCSERAMPLTDSLSRKYRVEIQRISAKNRNPKNAASLFERKLLDQFSSANSPKDTLLKTPNGYIYYKPIRVAMPTCLQCHGNPQQDIEATTLKTIQRKYRFDKATGYAMGELRGAWKLMFLTKQ